VIRPYLAGGGDDLTVSPQGSAESLSENLDLKALAKPGGIRRINPGSV
jgi:hypothetical protein